MKKSFLGIYSDKRILAVLLLNIAAGIPLALTASTLTIWLSDVGVDKASIGLFASVATPYALKFLWSPLVDVMPLPVFTTLFGQRRGWLIFAQLAVMASIVGLGMSSPAVNPWNTALFAFLLALSSATQDIAVDAYRVERFKPTEQGPPGAAAVFGYRVGMLISGAGALFLASHMSWEATYTIMALIMPLGTLTALMSKEPEKHKPKKSTKQKKVVEKPFIERAVIVPFTDFMQRKYWLLILLFVILYKVGDALAGFLTGPFLRETGFSKEEIAVIVKTYGFFATIIGTFIGGWMSVKLGIFRSLVIGGIFQMVSNLVFAWQAVVGHEPWMLIVAITVENFSGGMGSAPFVAYLSGLCSVGMAATQYALLSSLAAVGRIWLTTPSGAIAESMGWVGYFVFTTFAAVPGVLMIFVLQQKGVFKTLKDNSKRIKAED
ncbi:MAG: MFS transporter [Proteobacteria bacterium]|nr:MFS transporter [Pseudomonadota bacterium]